MMTKPFSINELLARVQSFGGLRIDEARQTALVDGNQVDLTGKEFDVLFLLASGSGRVFTKKQIYNEVWQDEYAFDDGNIMSYMSKLLVNPGPEGEILCRLDAQAYTRLLGNLLQNAQRRW